MTREQLANLPRHQFTCNSHGAYSSIFPKSECPQCEAIAIRLDDLKSELSPMQEAKENIELYMRRTSDPGGRTVANLILGLVNAILNSKPMEANA